MKISEIIAALESQKSKLGDVNAFILTGDWEDCRSSDWAWPPVTEVVELGKNSVGICTAYGDYRTFRRNG